jgi:hypothetical protein
MFAYCVQRRFIEIRNFLGAMGLGSPALISVLSNLVRLDMPIIRILGPPLTSVLPASQKE